MVKTMHHKRLISLTIAVILILSLTLIDLNNNSQTVSAQATGSVLDTPFQTSTDGSAKVSIDGTKFMVGEKELWFNGANTPWINWNDLGSTDGKGNSVFNEKAWDQQFAQLHENGINATRVWISCNGDVGMNIASDGTFEGATDFFWQDMDKLVKIAEKYQIYLMATVQSFDHYKNTNQNYKSWRALIQDDKKTNGYIDNFIIPLVKRYDSSDYFWSIDLCNEPDWIYENAEDGNISWDHLCYYYAKASAAIHKNSDVEVTVGLGMIKYNSTSYNQNVISDKKLQGITNDKDSYVDYYSTHWYAWEKQYFGFPFDKSPKLFKLDGTKPSVIGECAAKTTWNDTVTLTEKYQLAYKNDWNGVFAWKTSGSDDGCGLLKDITPATNAMIDIAKDKIFPLTTTLTSISDYDVELSKTVYTYNGKALTPVVTVSDQTKKLTEGSDYKVEYSNNTLPGTATVKITGIRDYNDTITKNFTIKLGVPDVTLSAGKGKVTVKWSKVSKASGYEILMATSENGKYSSLKKAEATEVSYLNKDLVSGNTYYYKVRAYIISNGKKLYGSHSMVKSAVVQ